MLYLIIAFVIIFLLLKLPYLTNKKYGDIGEKAVRKLLSSLPNNYAVKNNVRIGGYQIDHLVIVGRLIYVIETKYYTGTLSGEAHARYLNHNDSSIYNCILQNKSHCKAVQKVYANYYVQSVICFVGGCNVDIRGQKNCAIVTDNTLLDFICRTSIRASV